MSAVRTTDGRSRRRADRWARLRDPLALALAALLALGVMAGPASPAAAAPGDLVFGRVVVDANKNGAIDSGPVGTNDTGLAGVTVVLKGTNPQHPGWTTTTAADGSWSFPANADRSASPGPFTVAIDTSGAGGNNFIVPLAATPGANDFTRPGDDAQIGVATAQVPAGADQQELNALVYPTWKTDLIIASNPDGYEGNAILTGSGGFDGDDSEPGHDAGPANDRVRTSDVINFDWSITATAESSLDSNFTGWFEQTINLGEGAIANFGEMPDKCIAGSTITAMPSGARIAARQDPPAGTTSVVLSCNLGDMGTVSQLKLLPTQIFVSGSSENGATISTDARVYGADASGTATARPDEPLHYGDFEITAAPAYDIEKQRPWVWGLGQKNVNGVQRMGWEVTYSVQISAARKVGVEGLADPVTFEDSFWALAQDGTGAQKVDFPWEMVSCGPDLGNASVGPGGSTVYGKIGGRANTGSVLTTAENSVVDSGTCSFTRVGDAKTGNYKVTITGMDTSGSSFPTKSQNGSAIAADKHYVGAIAIKIFVPLEAVDAMDGTLGNSSGKAQVWNRVGDFDPVGKSGASNYGSGVEPGYCQPGPNTDKNTKCATMPGSTVKPSNNVAGPGTLEISAGTWLKSLLEPRGSWNFRNYPLPESSNTNGDGAGQVQPGQTYASNIALKAQLDTTDVQYCDVFDNSMMKLNKLSSIPENQPLDSVWGTLYTAVVSTAPGQNEIDRAKMPAFQANWTTKYAHVDLTGDNPNLGSFDAAHNRWRGDWTQQQRAASGSTIACGGAGVTWYDSPEQVPGGIDEVNAVWTSAKPGYVQPASTTATLMIGLQQRDTYHGGPHAGEQIPEYTIAANFANIRSSTFGGWAARNDFIPGAGTTGGQTVADRKSSAMGDRWTLVRARMAITKHTIDGTVDGVAATGASAVGAVGTARAGAPVIWQLDPSLNAVAESPAPVHNVTVTDTLPAGITYDEAATAAIPGNRVPSSATVNANGSTTLVWQLGTVVPNQGIPPLKIATHADAMLPNNSTLTNAVRITADGIAPLPSAHQATHTVTVKQPGSLQLKKSVDQTLDLQDKDQGYTLQVQNFSESLEIRRPTVIDVLPYPGDGTNAAKVNRNPASRYSGTSTLAAAPQAFQSDGRTAARGTFYYTTVAPDRVPQDLNADTDPSIWSTTYSANATAIKFVGADPLAVVSKGAPSGLQISYRTQQTGNAPGDLYSNRFTAFSDTLSSGGRFQLLASNQVMVRVVGFSLGDLIWMDADNDGKFTPGVDRPAPEGVQVQVFDRFGIPAPGGSVTTNADGRWVVNDLREGDYFAVIPASQFAAGGPLEGWAAQTVGAEADPNTDRNENADHHAAAAGDGSVRTGTIHLSATVNGSTITGQEPLNDNTGSLPVTPGTTDGFTNFTLDMALRAVPGFEFAKTADPESGTAVQAGDEITYTLTGRNTGLTELDTVIGDDLSEVLAYAELTADPVATIDGAPADPAAVLDGTDLSWTGVLQPGETVTIEYTVTVAEGHKGATLANRATSEATPPDDPAITPPEVVTEHPIPGYAFTKTSDPASGTAVGPGAEITYTLTGENTGATALEPVTISDDLSGVLDDAELTGEPVATIAGVAEVPAPILSGTELTWDGALAVGERVEITYTVTLSEDAEGVLVENSATSSATPPGLPAITPPPAETAHPTPKYEFAKRANPESGTAVNPGQTIEYTLTGTNSGRTVLEPVTISDDLSGVLAHASLAGDPVATIAGAEGAPQPIVDGTELSWEGVLQPGQTVEITYAVTLHEDAAGVIVENRASSSATPPGLPPIRPPEQQTWHPTPGYTFMKASDPASGTAVTEGDLITYTLTGTNAGQTVLDPVSVTDDLSGVLDAATLESAPVARIVADGEARDAESQPAVDGASLAWNGTLQPGEQIVITYQVRVQPGFAGETLQNRASSSATPPGLPPIEPPAVATEHPIPGYELTKTSDPASGSTVRPGQRIAYTVTGANTGATALEPVVITDDLSGVLDHAELAGEPRAVVIDADGGETEAAAPELSGSTLTWTGSLAIGERVEVRYAVTVSADAEDVTIRNTATSVATPPGLPPITTPPAETTHDVPPGLVVTGGAAMGGALALGALLLVGGAALVLVRRRSSRV